MIAYHKMLTKELLAVHPEKVTERKKRKKKLERQLESFLREMQMQKLHPKYMWKVETVTNGS